VDAGLFAFMERSFTMLDSNSFRQWLLDNLNWGQLQDLAWYGPSVGTTGLDTYITVSELYDRFHEDIWDLLEAVSLTQPHVLMFIACMPDAEHVVCDVHFKRLLVGYAAQQYAQGIVEGGGHV